MDALNDITLRREICSGMLRLEALGLNRGTSGNLSARTRSGFLITPSGVPPAGLEPGRIVALQGDGRPIEPLARPSSEWRFHRDIYAARPDAGAIVHVHSTQATALACHGRSIPAFHYMVAVAGGTDIRCAPYARFGSQALSDAAVSALDQRRACLLANHGMITLGSDIEAALGLAIEVEALAAQYLAACTLGEPRRLDPAEMDGVLEQFRTYGARHGES